VRGAHHDGRALARFGGGDVAAHVVVKRKVLFLAEAVTWSQVVRLVTLARGLDPARHEVHFASAVFDDRLFGRSRFRRWPIHSLSAETVDARVSRGSRIYDRSTLARYVEEELRLFEAIDPDLVVSDLRWSTCVSGPAFGVPVATLIDAYWFRALDRYPIPDHPIVRLLGEEVVGRGFAMGLPFVMRHFASPVNALRKSHGLTELGDLRDVLSFGDALLFPDDPLLVPSDRPGTYLGPISWAPDVPLPDWWSELRDDRPIVYVTMGSSGALSVVPKVLEALSKLDVQVVLSTAGRFEPNAQEGVRAVSSIRGDLASRRASVVVCSGGASTGWQALAEGTPVVGIPSNLDACLAMSCIEESGAGVALRTSAKVSAIRAAIERAMTDAQMKARAEALAASFARHDPRAAFETVIQAKTSARSSPNVTPQSTMSHFPP
jgi:UDP:flavonoid glycosyltransferase YjiC (YdhE family)